jgi:predicted PurR-regulated permease PerM
MAALVSTQRRLIEWLLFALAVAASGWVLWQARSLLFPCIVGAFLAYVCGPAVDFMERHGLPRVACVLLLALAGLVGVIGAGNALRVAAPSPQDVVEFKLRATHALASRYAGIMGFEGDSPAGNRFHRFVGRESDPIVAKASRLLALAPEEDGLLLSQSASDAKWQLLRQQHLEDQALLERHVLRGEADHSPRGDAGDSDALPVSIGASMGTVARLVSGWVTAFLLFVFILLDKGQVKRSLLALVPNRYFEPVLSIHSDLHTALQRYTKALGTQCVLLGLTVAAMLFIAGIPFRWANVIGFFAGMANVVPYAGMITALVGGMAYAILGYEAHPLLPFVDADSLPWAVLVAVFVTDAIKNAVYDPLVFGGALQLHPVVIILGVAAGAVTFGFLGALFAVPAIAFGRALAGSIFRQLRAYGEI